MKSQNSIVAAEQRANAGKEADAAIYSLPRYWILITPIEAQVLRYDVVSDAIKAQCEALLKPDAETMRNC